MGAEPSVSLNLSKKEAKQKFSIPLDKKIAGYNSDLEPSPKVGIYWIKLNCLMIG